MKMYSVYTGKSLDMLADACEDKDSIWEKITFTFVIILTVYIGMGTPVLLALMTGAPVTNPSLLYEPMVDIYMYFKYW
jgi:hypothetical protein